MPQLVIPDSGPPRVEMASQYLISFLARQYALLMHRFIERHTDPWLVWEPTDGATEVVGPSAAETWGPERRVNRTVAAGDALCFELESSPERPAKFRVGRNASRELVIARVPPVREYCILSNVGGWLVRASPETQGIGVSGIALAPGVEVPLPDSAVLELDGLRLLFLGPEAFAQRVAACATRLATFR